MSIEELGDANSDWDGGEQYLEDSSYGTGTRKYVLNSLAAEPSGSWQSTANRTHDHSASLFI
jgi:hypothetical protein